MQFLDVVGLLEFHSQFSILFNQVLPIKILVVHFVSISLLFEL